LVGEGKGLVTKNTGIIDFILSTTGFFNHGGVTTFGDAIFELIVGAIIRADIGTINFIGSWQHIKSGLIINGYRHTALKCSLRFREISF